MLWIVLWLKNKRQLYALVCETAKKSRALQEILDATQIESEEVLIKDKHLARALLYDLLFGKGLSGTDAVEVIFSLHYAVNLYMLLLGFWL